MTSPRFRQLRLAIYFLKRKYGQAMSLCRTTGDAVDLGTGAQTSDQLIVCNIARGIVCPSKIATQWSHAQPDTAVNRQFAFGGVWEHSNRLILVSRRDIPKDWPIDDTSYLIFGKKRYEVKKCLEYEEDEALGFIVDAQSGALVQDQDPTNVEFVGANIAGDRAMWSVQLSDLVLTASYLGTTFSNRGALAPVILTLPSGGSPGDKVVLVCEAAQYFEAQASAGQTIQKAAVQSAPGGYVRSNVPVSVIKIERSSPTTWVVMDEEGTWTVDS